MPVVQQVSAQVHTELSVGIGMYSTDAKQLKNAYKTAKFAFELYYFEEKHLIDFRDIHKDYTVSFEDYAKSVDEAYHAIILLLKLVQNYSSISSLKVIIMRCRRNSRKTQSHERHFMH